MPIISVIVPVYNVESYIHRCVDSILAQTFSDFELILVDDGSLDKCGEICDEYAAADSRIHVIHQENGGLSAARNAGLDWITANSKSEWISFIDSDDWVHIKYLELLYEAVIRFESKISQCFFLKTEKTVADTYVQHNMICVSPEEQYSKWYTANACGKLFHKSCFFTIRFPVGILFEDVSIWYKILFSLDIIAVVNEPLYYYFQRSDSIVNSSWIPGKLAQVDAWESQLEFAKSYGSKVVLQTVLKRLFWVYKHQCEEITSSSLINKKEKRKYFSKLIRRLRVLMLYYWKELKEMGLLSQYGSYAYPGIHRMVGGIVGICGKIKKTIKQ